MYVPDVNGLMSVAQQIAEQAPDGALVCIESTIPRGMTRKIFDLFSHRLHVAHVPHRRDVHEQEKYGINQLRVAGGIESCCLDLAIQFYSGELKSNGSDNRINGSLGNPTHSVESAEVAKDTIPLFQICQFRCYSCRHLPLL
jgi:UDP-N-acetyl-D-mannosaminuronic acid dehydrogenase